MNRRDSRIRQVEEAKTAARASLRTIETLCKLYDEGQYETARDIATVLHRLVVDELRLTEARRALPFISYSAPPNPSNLVMQYLASVIDVNVKSSGAEPTITVTHMPALEQLAKITGGPIVLKYNEWWGGIVEVDGVSNDHQVPTNKALHTPYKKRVKLSRSEVVTSLRNKVGAHYDREVDQVTQRVEDQLIRSLDVVVSVDGLGSFNQAETPDAFRFKNSRAQAIVRHIAFELSASAANWDF